MLLKRESHSDASDNNGAVKYRVFLFKILELFMIKVIETELQFVWGDKK